MKYFIVSANCSTGIISKALIELFSNYNFNSIILPSINDKTNTDNLLRKIEEVSKNNEVIWITSGRFELIRDLKIKTIKIPNIFFDAFHPDLTYATDIKSKEFFYPHYNSQIVIWCYNNRINLSDTERLFNHNVYRQLGYDNFWSQSVSNFKKSFITCEFSEEDFNNFFLKIKKFNDFMYSINHPKNELLFEFAKLIAIKIDKDFDLTKKFNFFEHPCLEGKSWAFYPDLANAYGLKGNYFWRFDDIIIRDLKSYITFAYDNYKKKQINPGELKPVKIIDNLDYTLKYFLKKL